MGTWFLATAYSSFVAAQIAAIATSPAVTAAGSAVAGYAALFDQLLWIGLIAGAALLLITPILKRFMYGIR